MATGPVTPASYGVLADAHTQLGQYQEAEEAVQKMADLRPDSSSLARTSYAFELRGDTGRAKDLMERALRAAGTPGERAFAHTHLSSLALDSDAPPYPCSDSAASDPPRPQPSSCSSGSASRPVPPPDGEHTGEPTDGDPPLLDGRGRSAYGSLAARTSTSRMSGGVASMVGAISISAAAIRPFRWA
ncbi:hypothetical protein Slala03_66080 [Streptomyces lavendulae subsp. lavendulae]|uniref:tetratricopeptide repeat protein n=1 Tax=Streptomyces lavendulae TaxID=1914 RepID=UPI0024A4AEA6|nr:hypothetical protein Slala03_66080 [Streptomyces lavendulae subsp. lavendulae]